MTTDLLGHPIPDVPAMNAPLPWRVFRMSDEGDVIEWVLARTEREAIAFYIEFCNELGDCRTEEEMREDGSINNVHELTDAELADSDLSDTSLPDPEERTFADQLAEMAKFAKVPMFFATNADY